MRWLGKYAWWKVAAVSIGNSVVFFLIFEIWFKVPLPKGPLERLLRAGLSAWMRSSRCMQRLRDRADAEEPRADVRRRDPRRDHRRAARPGRRQRRRDPAAAHLRHGAAAGRHHLGDHPALVHLLGRAVRRRHHLDPVQHPGRALVGGDHLRRLSAGAEGPRRRGAHRGVHLVVRRRAGGGDRHHLPLAGGGQLRARVRPAGVLRGLPAHLLRLHRHVARSRRSRRSPR